MRTLEIFALKYMNLILQKFLTAPALAWQAALKRTKVKSDLLTDIDMLLMVEKGIRREICHYIYQYVKASLHDKTEYLIHMRNLKQTLNHRLVLKKYYKVIKFNQSACLKPYIDMNTDLRKKAKNDFVKDFSWSIIQFLEKQHKMWEKIEILNL